MHSNRSSRFRPAVALATALLSLGTASAAHAAETLKLDVRQPLNESAAPNTDGPAQSSTLAAGTDYVIAVTGTASIWGREVYGKEGTCGAAEQRPMEIAPGSRTAPAAWDAATVFAAPISAKLGPLGNACSGLKLPLSSAPLYAGFEFATGGAYGRPAPVGGARSVPRSDHTYYWQVKGEGRPARFRFHDKPAADDTGVFTITIKTAAECAATDCLHYAGPAFDQFFAPTIPTAAISVRVVGERQCRLDKVLSVRLIQPKGLRFQKAAYYLNGKKKRVVGRKTMYINPKKGTNVRAQKFRNLPTGQLKLRIEVTTTIGQRLSIRRTIARCSPRIKARKIPAA